MNDIQEELGRSPELFPYEIKRDDSVAFVRLQRTDYETASFLDGRILTPDRQLINLPWRQVAAAIETLRLTERCGYIFHIGHVGSTLLSRLLGAHRSAFALREPAILRLFAQIRDKSETGPRLWSDEDIDERLGGCLKLLSRTFDTDQIAVTKTTSFVSEIASDLLSRPSRPNAVMMFVSPESYIATILGGPNSRREAAMLASSRCARLQARVGAELGPPAHLSEGETVALGWACETSALAQSASDAGSRVLRLDFDRFLADPLLLMTVLQHLGIDASLKEVHAILRGPHLRRYSKAPEHAYDAALRRDVLDAARDMHGGEIKRGLAWLERVAARFAPVAKAIAFAE
jgi:hypothetical protein